MTDLGILLDRLTVEGELYETLPDDSPDSSTPESGLAELVCALSAQPEQRRADQGPIRTQASPLESRGRNESSWSQPSSPCMQIVSTRQLGIGHGMFLSSPPATPPSPRRHRRASHGSRTFSLLRARFTRFKLNISWDALVIHNVEHHSTS